MHIEKKKLFMTKTNGLEIRQQCLGKCQEDFILIQEAMILIHEILVDKYK